LVFLILGKDIKQVIGWPAKPLMESRCSFLRITFLVWIDI